MQWFWTKYFAETFNWKKGVPISQKLYVLPLQPEINDINTSFNTTINQQRMYYIYVSIDYFIFIFIY